MRKYDGDKYVKNFTCYNQLAVLMYGLLADLIAYPITQYLLYPDRVNFAYDIVKNNIYVSNGKKLGLKEIPAF